MEERLSTELFVKAHLRQMIVQGIHATIVHRGDDWGGAILLHLNLLDGRNWLLSQIRDMEGEIAWLRIKNGADLTMEEVVQYIEKAVTRDPDLWVIEIEDKKGVNPFPGKIN